MKKPSVILIAALTVLPLAASAERPARVGDENANVLYTITLSGLSGAGGGERRVEALILDGERTRITTGWRVPTAATAGAEGDDRPANAVRYQNIGMGVTLHGRVVGPGRVRVSGEVDSSSIAGGEGAPPGAPGVPTVSTFRHVFDLILADGVRSTLVEVPNLDGGSVTLTLTAALQR